LAVGLFAGNDALNHVLQRTRIEQLIAQLSGMLVCCAWVTAISIASFLLIRAYLGLRVSPREETEGFDLSGVIQKPQQAPLSEAEVYALLGGDA
jgi:ammonia channel protein AmtB